MKKYILMTLLVFILALSGCSNGKVSNEWDVDDLAGIENPGFIISSKKETKDAITLELEDIDIELADQFLNDLYENPDFTLNSNYNSDTNSYSYAAFNDKEESIHFTYNVEVGTGTFIYAKSGNFVFIPGVRDMGYSVYASYDYTSNNDYTEYLASMFYNIGLNVKFTNSVEYLVSFVIKDFQFKSESTLGTLSFRDTAYDEPIENYTKTGSSVYDLDFLVVQKNIGQYPIDTPYGETSSFFDVMGINQSELQFTVSFTAIITTTSGTYSYDYEIVVMPGDTSVIEMDRYMTVEYFVDTIDKGIPFEKID